MKDSTLRHGTALEDRTPNIQLERTSTCTSLLL